MIAVKKAPLKNVGIVPLAWHAMVRVLLEIGKPPLVLMIGEPGTGKTTFAQHIARLITGRPPLVINGSPESDVGQIWGRWSLVGDETRFIDGPLPAALKSGAFVIIEEFSIIPVEVRATLLSCRDQEEIVNPVNPSDVIAVPPSFRAILTSNAESMTNCRKNVGINKVLYDGLLVFEVPELEDDHVVELLRHHFPRASQQRVDQVIRLWREYRGLTSRGSVGKNHLSVRAAMHLMSLLEKDVSENQSIQIALVNKLLGSDMDLFQAAKLKNSISDPEP